LDTNGKYYQIKSFTNDKCVTVSSSSDTVYTSTCDENNTLQKFYFDGYTIKSVVKDLCLQGIENYPNIFVNCSSSQVAKYIV
jgi:hypothetical protein